MTPTGMERHTPIVISTIGDLIDHGYIMWAHCRSCSEARRVDLAAVAERVGRGYPYTRPIPLQCRECGSRDVATSLQPKY